MTLFVLCKTSMQESEDRTRGLDFSKNIDRY